MRMKILFLILFSSWIIVSTARGTVNLWKCDLTGMPDTCEYYVKDLKVKKFCEVMLAKGQGWSEMIDSFQPSLRCPFEPQTYRADYHINDGIFRFFPVPTGIWKAKGFLHSDGQKILCLDFHARVIERRI